MLHGLKLVRRTVSLLEPLHVPLQAISVIQGVGRPTSDRPGGSVSWMMGGETCSITEYHTSSRVVYTKPITFRQLQLS
jgi:hypothetical protein